ncbi:MAG: TRAP transporter small permease [Parvularculales bacterium]
MLGLLERFSTRLSTAGAWIAAALLVYMVVHILVEIIARTGFDSSTYSLDEFVGYAIASMTFLSLGHTFSSGKLIRVNILTNAISGLLSLVVELICIAFTFSVITFFARYVWRSLYRNWERGAISPTLTETPIWLVESVFFIGLCIFLLQMLTTALVKIERYRTSENG